MSKCASVRLGTGLWALFLLPGCVDDGGGVSTAPSGTTGTPSPTAGDSSGTGAVADSSDVSTATTQGESDTTAGEELPEFPPPGAYFAPHPLEIIAPYEGLDTRNRYYKAYPGLELDLQVAVIGGAYPMMFELDEGPDGMEVGRHSGVLVWPDPVESGSPHPVTVTVTDALGSTASVSWTITVTTDGFRFIDAIGGTLAEEGGTGTIDDPWRSIVDLYEGNDADAKYRDTYAGEFIYFRGGEYDVGDAYLEDDGRLALTGDRKPQVWLAYPGESPAIDLGEGMIMVYSGGDHAYFEGIDFFDISNDYHKGLQVSSSAEHIMVRRNVFRDLATSTGSNNQSAVMIGAAGPGERHAYVGNEFYEIHHGYGIIAYDVAKVLVQGNVLHDIDDPEGEGSAHPIGPKQGPREWFIRDNHIYDCEVDGVWAYMGEDMQDIEISFNRIENAGYGVRVNQRRQAEAPSLVHVFRNTIVDSVPLFYGQAPVDQGPFYNHNNVIVNDAELPGHVECHECTEATLVSEDNLDGHPSDGIVDEEGALTPAYADHAGTHGHEIPGLD